MGLFDDKEDVLDIQLTQYGKKMLQLGKLQPVFYSFSDEDILYDSDHAGITENQNTSQERILNNTISLEPQYLFYGIETEFKKDINKLGKDEKYLNFQPEADKTYSSISSLGHSQLNNNFRPSWRLTMASAEISSSYPLITGSIEHIRLPQINLKTVVHDINFLKNIPTEIREQLELQNFESNVLENEMEELSDGSLIEVVNKDIFVNLEELNSIFQNNNFEIEMFLVEETSVPNTTSVKETLTPLYFKQRTFKRDEIYDDEEFFQDFGNGEIDSSMVEYYFNVEADSEIPVEVLCKYIQEDRRQGIYGKYFKCPDKQIVIRKNRYNSDAPSDEDICDD